MSNPTYPNKDSIKAIELYASGKSYAEIATLMRVNEHFAEGLVDRGDELKTAFDLRSQGMQWEEVGKRIGCTGSHALYLCKNYAQATGKPAPSVSRSKDVQDIYELVKKGYSPSLIKALGFDYSKHRLYKYCYDKKLPQLTQEKALKADARWSLMEQWGKDRIVVGEVLDRKPTYQGEYVLSSKVDESGVSIHLTFLTKVPGMSNSSTVWALSKAEVEEDKKLTQRPNWSTACDAVSLYMKECIGDDDFSRIMAEENKRRHETASPVAVNQERSYTDKEWDHVKTEMGVPPGPRNWSAEVAPKHSDIASRVDTATPHSPGGSADAHQELTQKLFKHAASTLDVTDPKTRQYLKDMLDMLGGGQ